jgi:hypothetical protein
MIYPMILFGKGGVMLRPGDSLIVNIHGECGEVIESAITYSDNEKSCGFARLNPVVNRKGIVIRKLFHLFSEHYLCAVEGISNLVDVKL